MPESHGESAFVRRHANKGKAKRAKQVTWRPNKPAAPSSTQHLMIMTPIVIRSLKGGKTGRHLLTKTLGLA